ncbi:MAG TPA: ABC-F family ATP-binding cassette domain-containing protein [Candidatus Pullichristensenella excrementipullorum]|nr:ABC-F family ATP-binding cassette domain-containing protein [Candidatus Pullichristensenella excrementipullorum]
MILMTVQGVSKAFGMKSVLKDISLTLQQGARMGLIGVNGSGKSTLFRLIAGQMEPDEGSISLMRGTRVGMLTQEADIQSDLTVREELSRVFEPVREMERRLRALEEEMAQKHEDEAELDRLSREYARLTDRFEDAGGYEWPSRIQGVLAGLGFARGREDQPASVLSGGEKTRLCLARLLLTQPDLLMLDEPTNHLDLSSIQWLEDTLKKYRGTVLIISHDRYFMNSVCDCMAEISMRRLVQYEGNYDQFTVKRQADIERQIREYKLQQAEIARQQAIIQRYRMYNREKSIRAAESREKRLEKMEKLERPVDEQHVRFSFEARRRTGDDVLKVHGLAKGFEGRRLFENFDLHLRAGDRVAIIGPNGVGKSTLLNIIARKLKADAGEVEFGANVDLGYYEQHQTGLDPEKDVLNELWDAFPRLDLDRVRSVLALFLFTGDDVYKKISMLSGGEKGRVSLCKLMLKRDNLLLLDEPTNHLDMDSREVLEGALEDFDGTILTVSHDRYFINRVADRIIEMRPDGVKEYLGNYDDYLEKKRREEAGLEDAAASGMTKTQLDKQRRKERLLREGKKALEKQLEAAEARIADAEKEIQDLETRMADPELYQRPDEARETARRHAELQAGMDALYEEWEALSEAVSER